MLKILLEKDPYTEERVELTTRFSDPHNRVVTTEEIAATHDLISEIYLKGGWGERFHYAPQARFERKATAILRWERFLVGALGAKPGMTLLDVGSGIGGPACDVARMTGANVLGLDVSALEIERANQRAKEMGVGHLCQFQYGDFNDLSEFPANYFDGIFSFQTICYSPDKKKTYEGFKRVLKPKARLAEYSWGLKSAFDPDNPKHVAIVEAIAYNVKCQKLEPVEDIVRQLRESGLNLNASVDLTELEGLDWTRPIKLFNHPLLKPLIRLSISVAGLLSLGPPRAKPVHEYLISGLPYYVQAHELDIFTPSLFLLAEKE